MSGICGQFNRDDAPVSAEGLNAVMAVMAGYGLDDSRIWHNGPVSLGQQMTAVTPESRYEKLPFEYGEGDWVVVADARLDNREELCTLLQIDHDQREVIGDGQLILRAYQHWGTACPQKLVGDFAFAIWDRAHRQIFCARDFLGVRPFYFHISRTGFYFASDIAALLEFAAVPHKLDMRYVRTRLEILNFHHKENSFFQDVFKLPPAYSLLVTQDSSQKSCYWEPAQTAATHYKTDEAYIEKLLELMQVAVDCRIRTDFPVGSHISGGLDSSMITTMAARALHGKDQKLHGFSWAPPPEMGDYPLRDERAVVQKICHRENVDLHFTPFKAADLVAVWTRDITTQPTETLIWELPSSRNAKSVGVRSLLSGWGGDEVAAFNGRGYFADLFRRGRWIRMTKELRLRAKLHDSRFREGFRNKVVLPLTPDAVLKKMRPHTQHLTQRQPLTACLQPQFAAELQAHDLLLWEDYRERPGVQHNQIALLKFGHLTERMESWSASGGRQGIAYNYPLLDRRIVEYCLSVPAHLYFKNGWKRYMFRQAAAQILPLEAQWKKMKDDPALTRQNMVLMPGAGQQVVNLLRERRKSIESRGYVMVNHLAEGLSKGEQTGGENGDCSEYAHQRLWLAFIVEP